MFEHCSYLAQAITMSKKLNASDPALHDAVSLLHAKFDDNLDLINLKLTSISNMLQQLREYSEADFEVIGLRFDRIEDRLDRLDSNIAYEH